MRTRTCRHHPGAVQVVHGAGAGRESPGLLDPKPSLRQAVSRDGADELDGLAGSSAGETLGVWVQVAGADECIGNTPSLPAAACAANAACD
eukprot:202390-Hanusia_phi.AAC.1